MAQATAKVDYPRQLYDYVQESIDEEEAFHFLGFEMLQRLNIAHLQYKLAEIKDNVKNHARYPVDPKQAEDLKEAMIDYTTAIQNYNSLHSMEPLNSNDALDRNLRLQRCFYPLSRSTHRPFDSHYFSIVSPRQSTDPVRDWLRHNLPRSLTYSPEERQARENEYESSKPALQISDFVDRLARFIAALTGGVFLIVPMLIMVLKPSILTKLITASVAVLLFSVALAFGLKANNVETLVSTATYAAVLVVFVGSSSPITT